MGIPKEPPAKDQPQIPQELVAALQVSTLELPEKCEELDPAILGVQLDTNLKLYHGGNCQVYMAPDLEGCAEGTVKLMSQANFRGVGAVWAPTGDLHVLSGEIFASIYRDVCDKFPKSSIKFMGIEIIPKGQEKVEISGKPEKADTGLMARLHMWTGEIEVVMEESGDIMQLKKGDQVYVKDGKVEQYYHFEETSDGNWEISEGPATKAQAGETEQQIPPVGCSMSDYKPYAHMPDALTMIIATLSALATTRARALMASKVPGKGRSKKPSKVIKN
ncbi:hypothetical protein HY604_01460 [Candidatus Peregrinibacteria bacterium]|nr:hypothetical protein [Candidatus Peregrinibacteria bacterium]